MFSKSNLFATISSFFVLYLLGWLFYGMIAVDFFKSHTLLSGIHKGESMDSVWQIAIGSLIISFFMATIYGKWANGQHSIKNGFEFGAYVGAIIGLGVGIIMYATLNFMDFTGTITDGIWNIFYYGFAGIAIALSYKVTE